MTGEFTPSIGALVAGAAPLWFVLLADIRTRQPLRISLLVGMLIAFAAATVAAGLVLAAVFSAGNASVREHSLQNFTSIAITCTVIGAAWLPLRRRALRRARWSAEHPDMDLVPGSRRERRLAKEIDQVKLWHAAALQAMRADVEDRGWVTASVVGSLDDGRPSASLLQGRTGRFLAAQSVDTKESLDLWRSGLGSLADALNLDHLSAVEKREHGFFDSLEKSPLTAEQRHAVVCFDDRVRLIAAAGSGKTSTLVAKAVFAVRSGLVSPDRVLVLAFNEAAAKEANMRLRRAFDSQGLDGRPTASTFHSFGLSVIGAARGRKPSVARAIEQKRELELLSVIVEELRDGDSTFRNDWDLFRNVYFDWREDGASFGDHAEPLLTRSGERVRSGAEALIADWLWYQGIEFEYERPFALVTADATHRQYTPDFYYPRLDIWHEHFALDRHGAAPPDFEGYVDDVRWKRQQHASAGTTLIETTMAEIDEGTALDKLRSMLTEAGAEFAPDAERPGPGRPPVSQARLLQLVHESLRQSRSVEPADVDAVARSASPRTRLFLRMLERVRERWEALLEAEHAIDYEGMILDAARALESGAVAPEFDLILIDEFQDMSRARARLVHDLLRRPGSRLFAVGDDWQAIIGFSGSDLGEIVDFHERWGAGSTLRLQRTFRSSQPICDVAADFVLRNPLQLTKSVTSEAELIRNPVTVQAVIGAGAQTSAASAWLADIQSRMSAARSAGRRYPPRTVLLLGRYRHTEQLAPRTSSFPDLRFTYSTVHSAKGLEADYVVLLDLVAGETGFPSIRSDDPILRAMRPRTETFEHAEERRLLYVALTRARRSVLVLTDASNLSPFVHELAGRDDVRFIDGDQDVAHLCPECRSAVLTTRSGRYGPFEACASNGRCAYRRSIRATLPSGGVLQH